MERFIGKVAVITGASSGIGAGIAGKLVEEGLIVIGLARRAELVEALAEKLKGKPGKLHAIKCDVGVEQELISALESIETKFGPIHVLVNNSGVIHTGLMTNGYTPQYKETMDVNFMATVVATTETVKYMQKNNVDGQIINIGSVCGATHMATTNLYGCSKAAMNFFCEVLRKDLTMVGSKIKVTVLSPGMVATEMIAKQNLDDAYPRVQVEDVVNSVNYILNTPPNVQIQHLTVRPVGEPY